MTVKHDPPPTVPVGDARQAVYRHMLDFLDAAGVGTSADGYASVLATPCGGFSWDAGYYSVSAQVGFVVPDNADATFRRLHDYARRSGFRIGTYDNPGDRPGATPSPAQGRLVADHGRAPRIMDWQLFGSIPGDYGFSIYTVDPQSHVVVTVGSGCRRSPDPDRDDRGEPYYLPTLPPALPSRAPLWTQRPTQPGPAPGSPGPNTGGPSPQALTRIRDLLG
ncbi:MAG: hypothetical protein HOV68_32660 [Streptomycetaceae bacterium]|nr:hypothetical protein [Streptomycetaceae bacterium]